MFDIDKLNWMNAQYLKKVDTNDILDISKEIFQNHNYIISDESDFLSILEFGKGRCNTINEIVKLSEPFFKEIDYNTDYLNLLKAPESNQLYTTIIEYLNNIELIDNLDIKEILIDIGSKHNINGKDLFFPIRLAVWGDVHGPDIGLIIKILGKEKAITRFNKALNYG